MEKQKIMVQAFRVENREIILDNLPSTLYDNIQEYVPEFYEKIDDSAWNMPVVYDDKVYYVIMSRNKSAVEDFMNAVLFAERILNA